MCFYIHHDGVRIIYPATVDLRAEGDIGIAPTYRPKSRAQRYDRPENRQSAGEIVVIVETRGNVLSRDAQ